MHISFQEQFKHPCYNSVFNTQQRTTKKDDLFNQTSKNQARNRASTHAAGN